MIVSVFRRRLRAGVSFDDFISAWEADKGFGVAARVFNAVSMEDPQEILSIGFVDVDASAFRSALESVVEQEAVRHSRIEAVIESTTLRAWFDLKTEHDFTGDPREIEIASAESLLASLQ